MKKILSLLLALAASASLTFAETGTTNGIGAFSVSAKRKVTFSPGNLQFNAAQGTHQCADGSTLQGTWRFAPNQWDIVGMGYGQTNTSDSYRCDIGGTVEDGDNRKISSTYNGWIDLFGWGTSGWNSGAAAYEPWSTSQNNADYYPGGSSDNTLTGDYAYADWGVYNQIGDDAPGAWRTLTYDEWAYLIYKRPNAGTKYGAAKVNGITGMVILPDKWTLPDGCGFTAGMTSASSGYDWSYVATTNIYTLELWQLMEDAGAVFLPCVGFRGGKSVSYVGTLGNSWSSSAYSISNSHYLDFKSNTMSAQGSNGRFRGRSVRLVSELDDIPGTYTVTFVNYDGSELQSGNVLEDETPVYTGETPVKPQDNYSTYTFSGWSDGANTYAADAELPAVTKDVTYTAVFTSEQRLFTVRFKNYDDSELLTSKVNFGETPVFEGTPVREKDGDEYNWYGFTFTGWADSEDNFYSNDALPAVTQDTVYTAQYSKALYIILQENGDAAYYTCFSDKYNGETAATATLNRRFTQGRWATLCLPFNVSKGMMISLGLHSRVYEFCYAETTSSEMTVYFAAASSIKAGKGYIVNANARLANRESFVFPNVAINTDADNGDISTLTGYNDNSGRGSIYLVGSLRTGLLLGTTNDNMYLGLKDNKIYYPNLNTGTSIRAYRGFFRSEAPLNVQRIRIIADGEERGELRIENEELRIDNSSAVKYISDGILYIERNGRTYNAQGQVIIDN